MAKCSFLGFSRRRVGSSRPGVTGPGVPGTSPGETPAARRVYAIKVAAPGVFGLRFLSPKSCLGQPEPGREHGAPAAIPGLCSGRGQCASALAELRGAWGNLLSSEWPFRERRCRDAVPARFHTRRPPVQACAFRCAGKGVWRSVGRATKAHPRRVPDAGGGDTAHRAAATARHGVPRKRPVRAAPFSRLARALAWGSPGTWATGVFRAGCGAFPVGGTSMREAVVSGQSPQRAFNFFGGTDGRL